MGWEAVRMMMGRGLGWVGELALPLFAPCLLALSCCRKLKGKRARKDNDLPSTTIVHITVPPADTPRQASAKSNFITKSLPIAKTQASLTGPSVADASRGAHSTTESTPRKTEKTLETTTTAVSASTAASFTDATAHGSEELPDLSERARRSASTRRSAGPSAAFPAAAVSNPGRPPLRFATCAVMTGVPRDQGEPWPVARERLVLNPERRNAVLRTLDELGSWRLFGKREKPAYFWQEPRGLRTVSKSVLASLTSASEDDETLPPAKCLLGSVRPGEARF